MILLYVCGRIKRRKYLKMKLLRRKVDDYLLTWKSQSDRMPLVIKGARQVGKTASVMQFAQQNYVQVVAINFVLQKKYKQIFDDGYEVDDIVRNITLINPSLTFEPGRTLLFFDEMQDCPTCATSLKSFKIDGRCDLFGIFDGRQLSRNRIE